jgi:DNA-binding LacI/PurR family transcriptional regulator
VGKHRHLLYERLYTYVVDEIRKGALRSGDRVPSETELARTHQVSRITSMRALQNLERAGIVERVRGKGSFVARDAERLAALTPADRQPQRRARRLTSQIAFLLPDVSPAYGLELLKAVEENAGNAGFGLVLIRSRGQQDVEERAIKGLVRSRSVDGLIVFPVNGEFYNASLLRLALEKYPLVLVDRYLKGIAAAAVYTDNTAAARELTGYVLDRGHDTVAFVSSHPEHTSSIEDRLDGFKTAFSERGLGLDGQHLLTDLTGVIPSAGGGTAGDRAAISALVERHPTLTGFVASEYWMALLLREALHRTGRLARATVVCFDSPRDELLEPRFTHVEQDEREIGRRAVELLLAQLDGREAPSQSIVPHRLVEGTRVVEATEAAGARRRSRPAAGMGSQVSRAR